jgi:heat shock protein 4
LEEEFTKCHAKCDKVSSWLYDKMDEQGSLPPHVDPAFTATDVKAKSQELTTVCSPIMHKPKPKPPPTPKAEEKPTETEKPADAVADPMETEKGEKEDIKMEVPKA